MEKHREVHSFAVFLDEGVLLFALIFHLVFGLLDIHPNYSKTRCIQNFCYPFFGIEVLMKDYIWVLIYAVELC